MSEESARSDDFVYVRTYTDAGIVLQIQQILLDQEFEIGKHFEFFPYHEPPNINYDLYVKRDLVDSTTVA